MNRQPYQRPPRWWEPKLNRRWIGLWKPFRLREQRKKHRLMEVEVRGLENVREAIEADCGVLLAPNHPGHADCFALYEAVERLCGACYPMVAWQVFSRVSKLRRLALQHHGCFSIDREGTGKSALRQARDVLISEPFPLTIFPEGDVYHTNDRVTPFREGPAAIAIMAAKKADRPIVVVPCAIKYEYIEDPTPELLELMNRLEEALYWRARPDMTPADRIYRIAEGVIALKEIEILGAAQYGSLPDRIEALIETVLRNIEPKYGLSHNKGTAPERVKAVRQKIIDLLEECSVDDSSRQELEDDMDDVFMVMQAFSYPGDYVSENPTIERIAETLDKFEEDVLGVKTATIRGKRKATFVFGKPIPVVPGASGSNRRDARQGGRNAVMGLTLELESSVQSLLDEINGKVDAKRAVENYGELTTSVSPDDSETLTNTPSRGTSTTTFPNSGRNIDAS